MGPEILVNWKLTLTYKNASTKCDENAKCGWTFGSSGVVVQMTLTHAPKANSKILVITPLLFQTGKSPTKLNERRFRALKYTLLGLSSKQFRNYGRPIKTIRRAITLKCLLTLYFYFHWLRRREAVFTDDLKSIGSAVPSVHCKERDVCSCFCYIRCYSSLKRCIDKFWIIRFGFLNNKRNTFWSKKGLAKWTLSKAVGPL